MSERSPRSPIDLHVGARLRQRRRTLGVTQAVLASRLGLTFQQLQKYERGDNRVSASKLYAAACALETPIAWFFDGLPQTVEAGPADPVEEKMGRNIRDFLFTREGLELAVLVPKLNAKERRHLVSLISALGD